MLLTEKQLSLFTKIVSTKLTKAELKAVNAKATLMVKAKEKKLNSVVV